MKKSSSTPKKSAPKKTFGIISVGGLLVGIGALAAGLTAFSLNTSSGRQSTQTTTQTTTSTSTVTTTSCPDAGACNADAQTYCPNEWSGTSVEASWKLDLVNCLYKKHKNELSSTCLESLECRQTLNEQLVTACKDDQKKYCAGVTPAPGSEPLVDCIEANLSKVSTACFDAWTAHDLAKPDER